MIRFALLALLTLAAAIATPAFAVQPDEQLADPALEARAREISEGLRCLVCQNQSIDDSGAPLARDLRILVRQRLEASDSDTAVRSYLVSRYGDFILLKPPFEWSTLLLWGTPAVVLVFGAAIGWRARRGAKPPPALSAEEEKRLAGMLRE